MSRTITTWVTRELAQAEIPKDLLDLEKGDDKLIVENNLYQYNNLAIGRLIRGLRIEVGLSVRGLAKVVNISHTQMSELERGIKSWQSPKLAETVATLQNLLSTKNISEKDTVETI